MNKKKQPSLQRIASINWEIELSFRLGKCCFFFDPIFCFGQNQCVFFYSIWSVHSILLFWQNCFKSKQCLDHGHGHTWIVENTSLLKHSIYYEQTMHENVERETEKKEDRKKAATCLNGEWVRLSQRDFILLLSFFNPLFVLQLIFFFFCFSLYSFQQRWLLFKFLFRLNVLLFLLCCCF